ncbi:MAG: hypothetical protein R3286_03090 [Gammaproteobacteria bacterium]|nr:hypothetical protein [Gammaproteobacteria bacterium]
MDGIVVDAHDMDRMVDHSGQPLADPGTCVHAGDIGVQVHRAQARSAAEGGEGIHRVVDGELDPRGYRRRKVLGEVKLK